MGQNRNQNRTKSGNGSSTRFSLIRKYCDLYQLSVMFVCNYLFRIFSFFFFFQDIQDVFTEDTGKRIFLNETTIIQIVRAIFKAEVFESFSRKHVLKTT